MASPAECFRCGDLAVVGFRASKDDAFAPVCEECRVYIVRRIEQFARIAGRGGPNTSEIVAGVLERLEFKDIRPFILLPPSRASR